MEIRRDFHEQMNDIHRDLLHLAAMVGEVLPQATEVLLGNDLEGAQRVIEGDDVLDALSIDIEERCCQTLALQQPMAGDLRAIVTAIRLASELERSGDLVVNICKAARRLYPVVLDARLRGIIQAMSDDALRLHRLAVDAYDEGDASLASALDDMDDRLDELHADFIGAIFESHSDQHLELQPAVQLALVGRYYERIGDHAVNIGERVRYMVTGWLPEHTGAARLAARTQRKDDER